MTEGRTFRPALTRRQLLKLAALGSVAVSAGVGLDELVVSPLIEPVTAPEPSPPARRAYQSRPDLTPPVISVSRRANAQLAAGVVLLSPGNGAAPDGPLIATDSGEPVWFHPVPNRQATNFGVASFHGQPVLTWWEGAIDGGYGLGEYVIADAGYREVARVRAGNRYVADLHELVITADDTALLLATNVVAAPNGVGPARASASPPARPPASGTSGRVMEAVVQEIEITSGRVLFEWHSLPDIDPSESYAALPTDGTPYDYLHANSIDVDGDAVLLSARHTWAVYRIDRRTGRIIWRLNGRRSDFDVPSKARFAWQHDARRQPDGTISIFDDGAMGPPPQFETQSRGIIVALDETARTARVVQSFVHPEGLLAFSQGSLELLPGGGAFIGWGNLPRFSEFSRSGDLVLDASFAAATQSYRCRRQPWIGRPAEPPAVVVAQAGGEAAVFVSWNGATEVARWELLDGASAGGASVGSNVATGFETRVVVPATVTSVIARAVDRDGAELGRSAVVNLA
jgi:Arylsulfotransferase (ASST)